MIHETRLHVPGIRHKNVLVTMIALGMLAFMTSSYLEASAPAEAFRKLKPEEIEALSPDELQHLSAGIPADLDESGTILVVRLFERWAENDPTSGLTWLIRLPTPSGLVAAEAFFTRAARLYPESIDQWASNLPDKIAAEPEIGLSVRAQQRMRELVRELGVVDLSADVEEPSQTTERPAAAAGGDASDGLPDARHPNPVKAAAWDICVMAKATRDPEAARELCVRLVSTSEVVPERGIEQLCSQYASTNPQAGASFIKALGMETVAGMVAMEAFAPAWAKRDFSAVIDWMADWEPDARDSILALLARSQPERCVEVCRLFSPSALENEGNFQAIVDAVASHGAAGAAGRLNQLPANKRSSLLWEVFLRVVDTPGGSDGVRTELNNPWPHDIQSGMATALAFRLDDVREAAELLVKHLASDPYPLRSVSEQLAALDLAASLTLLASQPEELAEGSYYETWCRGAMTNPSNALALASNQTSTALRSSGCLTVLRQWAWQAPENAAKAWGVLATERLEVFTEAQWAESAAFIAAQWASQDRGPAVSWARSLPPGRVRGAALPVAEAAQPFPPGFKKPNLAVPPFNPPTESPPPLK